MSEGLDLRELEAIKARAKAVRRAIQAADEAKTMRERERAAILLVSGSYRVDDDLFTLLAEVERLWIVQAQRDDALARVEDLQNHLIDVAKIV